MHLRALSVAKLSMRAFTFVEVVLTVAIVLIVSLPTAWFSINFFFERQVVLTSQLIRSNLVQANIYALNGRANSDWGVTLSSNTVSIFAGTTYDERDRSYDESFTLPRTVNVTGLEQIIFTRATGTATPAVIEIRGHNRIVRLSVNSEGTVLEL